MVSSFCSCGATQSRELLPGSQHPCEVSEGEQCGVCDLKTATLAKPLKPRVSRGTSVSSTGLPCGSFLIEHHLVVAAAAGQVPGYLCVSLL